MRVWVEEMNQKENESMSNISIYFKIVKINLCILTSNPIFGHSFTVDVLEGVSCNNLISGAECYNNSSELYHEPSKGTSSYKSFEVVITKRLFGRNNTKNVISLYWSYKQIGTKKWVVS